MSLRSMTGYGQVRGRLKDTLELTISVRTVNHRFLEVSVRLPEILWDVEAAIKSLASEFFSRGKVDVSIRLQAGGSSDLVVRINSDAAKAAALAFREIQSELEIDGDFGLQELISIPGVVESEAQRFEIDDGVRQEVSDLVRSAFQRADEMRETEGEGLKREIGRLLDGIDQYVEDVASQRQNIVDDLLDNYRRRVAEIASSVGTEMDDERLAQEIVLMVEKGDIVEELSRLDIHLSQVRAVIESGGAVGKKLDFLAQEILREINTIGSKSKAAGVRSLVVELKTEVERIREQVQNVE